MVALASTASSRTAERVMSAYFGLSLERGAFLEYTAPNFSADTLALCRVFGMTPVKLHYAGADRRLQFEAFVVNDPADRRIFLTNHARSPERALIGHELVHRMRRERPDLYAELVEALANADVDHERWAAFYTALREQTGRKEGRELSDEEIREEGIADLVGDLILEPAVWRALRRPTLLQRVHEWIRGVWRSLQRSEAVVDPLGGAGLVRDRDRAVAAVSRVLSAWAANLDLQSPADAGEAPVPASAAALRRDESAPEGAFRSALLDALVAARGAPVRASWQQWLDWLDGAQRRGEFRQSERAWLGLDDFVKARDTVARHELVEFVREHQVRVQEVVLGADGEMIRDRLAEKFEKRGYTLAVDQPLGRETEIVYYDPAGDEVSFQELPADLQAFVDEAEKHERLAPKHACYQLPGGANYRELLLTLPLNESLPSGFEARQMSNGRWGVFGPGPLEENRYGSGDTRSEAIRAFAGHGHNGAVFRTSHFEDVPNVLAHVRFNERTDVDGKRVLFLEEIQSDLHQTGRKKGYFDPDSLASRRESSGAVPDAPFKSTEEWTMLAFKRMVRWAAEFGFDRIAWTTGDQQVERNDLSQHIKQVHVLPECKGTTASANRAVQIETLKGTDVVTFVANPDGIVVRVYAGPREWQGKPVAEILGADLTTKIMAIDLPETLSANDVRVGGDGMRAFYDKILPASVNKWAKRFGAKVGLKQLPGSATYEQLVKAGQATGLSLAQLDAMPVAERKALVDSMLQPVHSLDLTPAMRDAALSGLPLFRRRDPQPDASTFGCPYNYGQSS